MRLRVIAVGRRRDPATDTLCDTYATRSRALLPIERIASKDTATALARARTDADRVILLDERGDQPSTPELARWLSGWRDDGVRALAFVIGDAHGFSDADRRGADRLLGLSRLTLPHRLAQVVLCEQLYRAGTILAGHPYHHA